MRTRRRGAAMVELALLLPVLLLILMGIIEFGLMLHVRLMLDQGAREGAQAAAIGRPVDQIVDETIHASLSTVRPSMVRAQFRDTDDSWKPIVDTVDKAGKPVNAVPDHAMVRVTIEAYPHRLIMGSFFSWLPGYKDGSVAMTAGMRMRREPAR
jgi:hypothetical protein